MITCAKCGGRVGVIGPCRQCAKNARTSVEESAPRLPLAFGVLTREEQAYADAFRKVISSPPVDTEEQQT